MEIIFRFPRFLCQYVVVLTLWGIGTGWYVSVIEATESTCEPLIKQIVKCVLSLPLSYP